MKNDLTKNKKILSKTLISELAEKSWDNIHAEDLILNCNSKISENYKWLANDKFELLIFFLKDSDDEIILNINKELLFGNELSIIEKLKELILLKCEYHSSDKSSFNSLQKEMIFKPSIFLVFLNSFKYLTNQCMILFGDDSGNFKNKLRINAVSVVFFTIFFRWVLNKDKDLSSIMKITDEFLNNAEEIGKNFGMIK